MECVVDGMPPPTGHLVVANGRALSSGPNYYAIGPLGNNASEAQPLRVCWGGFEGRLSGILRYEFRLCARGASGAGGCESAVVPALIDPEDACYTETDALEVGVRGSHRARLAAAFHPQSPRTPWHRM